MPSVLHILHGGLGGQAGVCFALARAGKADAEHCIAFYGTEPAAPINRIRADELGLAWRDFRKASGLALHSQRSIMAWATEFNPDAVIAHSPATLYACRLLARRRPGLRIIAVEHHPNALKSFKQWVLSALALRVADHVVYLTPDYRATVRKTLGVFSRSGATSVIPNGLDLSLYPQARGSSGPEFVIGMQGRMVPVKDFETLIRAAASLKQHHGGAHSFRFEFAGDGPLRGQLEALAADLGVEDEIAFLGMLPQQDLIERMGGWDLFAFSTFGETMSVALLEAQALGLPVLAANSPGVNTAIRHGETGMLVTEQTADAWAHAISEIARDDKQRHFLAANTRAYVAERFSIKETWAAYRSLIEAPPTPSPQLEDARPQPAQA